MWSFTGREVLLVLAACGGSPDAHVDVTRPLPQRVDVVLCDLGTTCEASAPLFVEDDPVDAVKSIEIFIDDDTDALRIQFAQFGPNLCSQLSFTGEIEARVTLTDPPAVTGCTTCMVEACGP